MPTFKIKNPGIVASRLTRAAHLMIDDIYMLSRYRVPIDTGALYRSAEKVKRPSGGSVAFTIRYSARQEMGIKPGTQEKVKRHSVREHTRRTEGRAVTVRQHERGPFIRTYSKGMKGKWYLSSAWADVRNDAHSYFARALRGS